MGSSQVIVTGSSQVISGKDIAVCMAGPGSARNLEVMAVISSVDSGKFHRLS